MGLSPGGCRFSFDKSSGKSGFDIKIGQKVKISFKLPGLESTQKFVCKTQNIQRDNDSLSLGLQFDLESGAAFSPTGVLQFLEDRKRKK
ncbi:MAG: PilZ domain-containing protein [Deltaproteobacteria bacterium]|nr:PilZ domain-containing protein [Deltaproteobacteria bacterium]